MKIYLASKSPRRYELLKQIGINFEVVDVDINEDSAPKRDIYDIDSLDSSS